MRRHTALALTLTLAAVLALGTASAVPTQRVLVVEDAETGEPYLTTPVENGSTVAVVYTHSVEKTRVYDGYTVDGDRLVMSRMEFESYGWGLPSRANVTREDGRLVYDPPGAYERFTVAPGSVADHRLRVDGRTYDLVALSEGRSVDLHLTRRSALAAATDSLEP